MKRPGFLAFLWAPLLAAYLGLALAEDDARAAPSQVALVRTTAPDPFTRQVEILLQGELRAAGFVVDLIDQRPGHDIRDDLNDSSAFPGTIAAMTLLPVPGGPGVEVRVADWVTGKVVIKRIDVGRADGEGAADLALRAVGLLRGSLLEIAIERPRTSPASARPPADVTRFVDQRLPLTRAHALSGLGLAGGILVTRDGGGLGAAVAPLFRLSYGYDRGWVMRLALAIPGSHRAVNAIEGSADVRQDLGAWEGLYSWRPRALFQPYLITGAGLLHTLVVGTGVSSLFPGERVHRWAMLGEGGGGIMTVLGSRAHLWLEGLVMGSTSSSGVRIAGGRVAGVGGLALGFTAGFASVF